jgi:MFS transporter, YNFM family, putative membrane transport protein
MGVILFATILTLSALYAPQPLLPVIMAEFAVSRETAAFLTTITFLPLSIAPLFYGYILESVAPRRMLRYAIMLLAISQVLFYFAQSFPMLVGIRLFQGFLIPAILTSLMTYISLEAKAAEVQRSMAVYVAGTIVGGFLGRACSGAIATWFGWRASFLVLAGSLTLCFLLLGRLAATPPLRLARPTFGTVGKIFGDKACLRIYLVVFCLFLVFAAVMNYLPFRLTEISEHASEMRIGFMYSGYLMGLATSLGAVAICRRLGGETRSMAIGLSLFAVTLAGLGTGKAEILFPIIFFFCGAMFFVHAIASGYLNRLAPGHKGIVNGLYVSFYYAGGAVGSYLPGFIYRGFGWKVFLLSLLVTAIAALGIVLSGGKQTPGPPKTPTQSRKD